MCRQIPIGAAHISFSGHTQMRHPTSKTNPQVSPRWPRSLLGRTNTQRSTGPGGGVKIRWPSGSGNPREKEARWQMVKPMLGIAGGVLFKANCQGVPIITQPRKERKIREHNTDMTETRAARVEQNTRREAEPSTLYQVYRCIKITWQYNDIPTSK